MHQGLRRDDETGLHENRFRMLHSRLGRFLQRDPLGYVDSMGLYEYLRSEAIQRLDSLGLLSLFPPGPPSPDDKENEAEFDDVTKGLKVCNRADERKKYGLGLTDDEKRAYAQSVAAFDLQSLTLLLKAATSLNAAIDQIVALYGYTNLAALAAKLGWTIVREETKWVIRKGTQIIEEQAARVALESLIDKSLSQNL